MAKIFIESNSRLGAPAPRRRRSDFTKALLPFDSAVRLRKRSGRACSFLRAPDSFSKLFVVFERLLDLRHISCGFSYVLSRKWLAWAEAASEQNNSLFFLLQYISLILMIFFRDFANFCREEIYIGNLEFQKCDS